MPKKIVYNEWYVVQFSNEKLMEGGEYGNNYFI